MEKFEINFRKWDNSDCFENLYMYLLTYFDLLITNMTMKIGANDIF